jgi:hypothetical protein
MGVNAEAIKKMSKHQIITLLIGPYKTITELIEQ